jgi:hypothetical protein
MNAITAEAELDPITDIEATVNYIRLASVDPQGIAWQGHNVVYGSEIDARMVTIHDARRTFGLGLHRSGFELLRHHGTLGNWQAYSDAGLVREIDYPEVAGALRRCLHAEKVLVVDHKLRTGSLAWEQGPRRFEPVRRVNAAPTSRLAAQQVQRHLDQSEASHRLQRRFAMVRVYRPIGGAAVRLPLAVCDARTIRTDDLFATRPECLGWPDEPRALAFSHSHRWYWYPRHSPQEAILIKVFDSATHTRQLNAAYTAFDNPQHANGTAAGSIEAVALVFW